MTIDLINWVEEYIENEIDYIKQNEDLGNDSNLKDLEYLRNISDEKVQEIANAIKEDDELYEKINELVHYYLYH